MKIKDLIKELKLYEPEAHVIMSSDGEGNSYHDVWEVGQFFGQDLIVGIFPSDENITP